LRKIADVFLLENNNFYKSVRKIYY